ncbi:hypothetical protein NC651_024754 [Populus alba x Populus x berolinensis]|nr:hypothetical protein NC651_024754 [Populus alba x Populus x berolinensis]
MSLLSNPVPLGLASPNQLHARRQEIIQITSGSRELDKILEGKYQRFLSTLNNDPFTLDYEGLRQDLLLRFMVSSTQEKLSCATHFASLANLLFHLPLDQGGGEGKAMSIDAEGAFRPQRLLQIADSFGLNDVDVLENVAYGRAHKHYHQSRLLLEAASMMTETRFALMIVGSSTALYRTDFSGRENFQLGRCIYQSSMGAFRSLQMSSVWLLASQNQLVAKVDGSAIFAGTQTKPIGVNIMARASTSRSVIPSNSTLKREGFVLENS